MLALGEEMGGGADAALGRTPPDLNRDVFMGHEFAAEILEFGPDTVGPPPGTIVTSIPVMLTASGVRDLVYSNDLPAGYSERMLLSAPLLVPVPQGLDPRLAALTEPMAVGLHAVNRAEMRAGEGALVLGCGPVGLAVIAALAMAGVEPIVATDFSPTRRSLATVMGAHEAVDPREEPAFEAWQRLGRGSPVVFDAVGVPGMINDAMRDAPARSRLVIVGVCMEPDRITPFWGIAKELAVQFVLGYDPAEFAGTLSAIAEGRLDVAPLITAEVPLDGVPDAFAALDSPDSQAKILVVP
jgi:threonine dehydrogenase-like Zn-dependent dehydrogenase